MRYFFENIISIQFGVSILIILMLLLRGTLKKYYVAKLRYWLWMLIVLRLCVPMDINVYFNHPAPVNIPAHDYFLSVDENTRTENITKYEIIELDQLKESSIESSNAISEVPKENKITYTKKIIPVMDIMYSVWFIVAISLISCSAYVYITTKSELLDTMKVDENLNTSLDKICKKMKISRNIKAAKCDYNGSPMLIGIIEPIIVFPNNNYTETEIEMILRHELTHFRRNDIVYKFIAYLVCCVYWFNPLVYVMAKYIGKDIEISCDEDSVKNCNKELKIEYAQTILRVINMKNNKLILATNFSQSAKNVKERFKAVLFGKKLKKGKSILACSIAVMIFVTSFVGCSQNKELPEPNIVTEDQDFLVEIGNINTKTSRCVFDNASYYGEYIIDTQAFDNDEFYFQYDKEQDTKYGSMYNATLDENGKVKILCSKPECQHNSDTCPAKNNMNGNFFTINDNLYFYSPTTYIMNEESSSLTTNDYISVYKVSESGLEEVCILKNYVNDLYSDRVFTDGKDLYLTAKNKNDSKKYLLKVNIENGIIEFETEVGNSDANIRLNGITEDGTQIIYTYIPIIDNYEDIFLMVYNTKTNIHENIKVISRSKRVDQTKNKLLNMVEPYGNYIYMTDFENSQLIKQKLGTENIEVVTNNLGEFTEGSEGYGIVHIFDNHLILSSYYDNGEKFGDIKYLSIDLETGEKTPISILGEDVVGLQRLARIYGATPNNLMILLNTSEDDATLADFAIISKADFLSNNPQIVPIGRNRIG